MVTCAAIIADDHAFIHKETAMPAAGKKAPAFNLLNQDGQKVKLADFQGKMGDSGAGDKNANAERGRGLSFK